LKYFNRFILAASFFFIANCLSSNILAQDSTSASLAFKSNRPRRNTNLFYHPDLAYQLWQQFKLIQEANSGDPMAMHELGLRYLLGEGSVADTVQAAYWIGKAAEKKLPAAEYNYAILLNNGWGVSWNPFKAYQYFKDAALSGMPQAEYVYGILNTNDFIVKRNWDKAYTWVKKAADGGNSSAKEILGDLKKRVSSDYFGSTKTDSGNSSSENTGSENESTIASNLGLVFIDFSSKTDSVPIITDKQIIDDIWKNGSELLNDTLGISSNNDSLLTGLKKTGISYLEQSAEAGNPEALTLIGRLYEKGIYYNKSLLKAALHYLRATRLDSPTAPAIMWYMIRKKDYFTNLKKLVDENNPDAMYIWYELYILGFDQQFTEGDAFNLLNKAANQNVLPAVVELGLSYFTGKFVNTNKEKALSLWTTAEKMGSIEASIRIATAMLLGEVENDGMDTTKYLQILNVADNLGSVLAQVTLGYCYENGIGVSKSIPEAVKFYRLGAQRGNRYAFDQLKRMYDSIRPPEFQLN
jgi:uncharacterized protein